MRAPETYCGPTALAAVTGMTRADAWAAIAEHEPRRKGLVQGLNDCQVLGAKTVNVTPRRARPTLARWLRDDGRDAIVLVSRHFVVVKGGEVVADNGRLPMRGRVTHFVLTRGLS